MKHLAPSSFRTRTFDSAAWGEAVCRILHAAVQAVDPYQIVSQTLQLNEDTLRIDRRVYRLSPSGRVLVLALGKAGAPMTLAAVERLGERLESGLVITKPGHAEGIQLPPRLRVMNAEHPVPGQGSLEAGRQAEFLASSLEEDDMLLCLISGGGSSLCVSPAPPVELTDLQRINASLLGSGADITEINTVRKHLETLKGGGLSRLAAPGRLASLILSDVLGDRLDAIASGPTAADPTTFAQALQVLEQHKISEKENPRVFQRLRSGVRQEIEETPKPDDAVFAKVQNAIVGNNLTAVRAAVQQARKEGFHAVSLTSSLQGEARTAGQLLAAHASQVQASGEPVRTPACLVAGGETTVRLSGEGLGGRNLELALGAVAGLDGMSSVALVTLATDGGDGPTDAAGAVVTGETLGRALQLGLNPEDYLQRNDSYRFFEPLGDLIKPGPTQTNVNDLSLIFLF